MSSRVYIVDEPQDVPWIRIAPKWKMGTGKGGYHIVDDVTECVSKQAGAYRDFMAKDGSETDPQHFVLKKTATYTGYNNYYKSGTGYACLTIFFNELDKQFIEHGLASQDSSGVNFKTGRSNMDTVGNVDSLFFCPVNDISVVYRDKEAPNCDECDTIVHYYQKSGGNYVYQTKHLKGSDGYVYGTDGLDKIRVHSLGGTANVFRIDLLFKSNSRTREPIRTEQVILGRAYMVEDFDTYEVSESCNPLLDDIPYNTLNFSFRSTFDFVPKPDMMVYNYVDGKPFGKFLIENVERVDKDLYSVEATDTSILLEDKPFFGCSSAYPLSAFSYVEYLINKRIQCLPNEWQSEKSTDGSACKMQYKYYTNHDVLMNQGDHMEQPYGSGLEDRVTGKYFMPYNDPADALVESLSNGFCDKMTCRQAISLYAQYFGAMAICDRRGSPRLKFTNNVGVTDNGRNKDEYPAEVYGRYRTPNASSGIFKYFSDDIIGEAVFKETPQYKMVEYTCHQFTNNDADFDKLRLMSEVKLPDSDCKTAIVEIPEPYLRTPIFFHGETALADGELECFPIERTYVDSTDSSNNIHPMYPRRFTIRPKGSQRGWIIQVKLPETNLTDTTSIVSYSLNPKGKLTFNVDNTLMGAYGGESNCAVNLKAWLNKSALLSPGTISASVVLGDKIPELGDTLQIETAFQGTKQGILTSIALGYDAKVADVEIMCFKEGTFNANGTFTEDPVYSSVKNLKS